MQKNNNRNGFTLIELLTVIAIIALLAAIIFPVFAQVRNQVRKTSCTTALHKVGVALRQYKLDYGSYPSSLAPLAVLDIQGMPLALGDSALRGQLYPDLIRAYQDFSCPMSQSTNLAEVVPANPNNPFVPMQLNYDKFIRPYTLQFSDGLHRYYAYDSYDGETININGTLYYDVHYSKWRQDDQLVDTSIQDPRQLKFKNPPDNTVVTWCSYHRRYDVNGIPESGSMDLVLFLDGHVEPRDSKQVIDSNGWQLPPKP
ncbi:MAG: prepilin-type N-terminal cleavage/methylation domain-containing protein [Armatimonadetes bacterium]|nr:prepilin-type N-terminal cleavage/methylation domain-containing protein [Armatimonadota bacterium]